MLIRFRVQNFRSILEEQEVSFVAYNQREKAGSLIDTEHPVGLLLRAISIYGANASGKSNFLNAFGFFRNAVSRSQSRWREIGIPMSQFASLPNPELTSRFVLDFIAEDVRYEYGFSSTATEFTEEWLFAYPKGRKQVWFERTNNSQFAFGKRLQTPENRRKAEGIAPLVRPYSLFLSAAIQNNFELLKPVFNEIATQWTVVPGSRHQTAMRTAENSMTDEVMRTRIGKLLQAADLGLVGYEVDEELMSEAQQKMVLALINAMPESEQPKDEDFDYKVPRVLFVHENEAGANFKFNMSNESDGTVAYFGLLGPVIETLKVGGLLIVDEIETSLHPKLAAAIVEMFNNPEINSTNAQLIFSTHASTLLTEGELRRDQIWIAEKDRRGATKIFPLTDFHLRKGERVDRGYLQGRFGGIPFIDRDLIRAFVSPTANDKASEPV